MADEKPDGDKKPTPTPRPQPEGGTDKKGGDSPGEIATPPKPQTPETGSGKK